MPERCVGNAPADEKRARAAVTGARHIVAASKPLSWAASQGHLAM